MTHPRSSPSVARSLAPRSSGLRALALLLALALVGCSSKGPDGAAASADTAPAPADTPVGTQPGMLAPNFELPVLSGGEGRLSLQSLRGKVVLLTFWASWCGPCRLEVPALEKPWKELRDADVVIVGISIDDDAPAAASFLRTFPVTYPMLLDAGGGTAADSWGVSSIPATVLIDKKGVVHSRHLGYSPTMLANTVRTIRELEQE